MCFLLQAKNSRYFLVVYIFLVGVFTYLRVSHFFLCAVLTVAASLGVAQAQTKIKYGAYHTANETFIKEITQMMDTITERTDGEVVFEPYYAGSLLKAQDLYPGMSCGAGDMGV